MTFFGKFLVTAAVIVVFVVAVASILIVLGPRIGAIWLFATFGFLAVAFAFGSAYIARSRS